MKQLILFLFYLITSLQILQAQSVGVGTTTPDATAQLDIRSTSKGVLIPRLTKTERLGITTPATGLLVYQRDADSSFFIYNGNEWTKLLQANSGWSLSGNLNTNSSHFIGTLDRKPVIFKMNNGYAGKIDTSGSVSFGRESLSNNSPDRVNTAFGDSALFNNSTGATIINQSINNTAVGAVSLKNNTTGFDNTATGSSSLTNNTTGFQNTAAGFRSLQSNTNGFWNTASGWQSLAFNTTGLGNTAFGYQSLNFTTTANYNTGIGYQALLFNTTGFSNTAIGVRALFWNTVKSNLVAVGDSALYNNGVGATSTFDGMFNCAVGSKALYSNTTGNGNTATGSESLYSNTTAGNNTAFGYAALRSSTGIGNTGFGAFACGLVTSGNYNTAIGWAALSYIAPPFITGSYNIGIGPFAGNGSISTGSNNIMIGYNSSPPTGGSNQVRIGDNTITYAGIQVAWTITSDSRYKEAIENTQLGLNFITALRPVNYLRTNNKKEDEGAYPGTIETGFIAQEVEQVLKQFGFEQSGMITKDSKGYYGMRYNDLLAPMVKAIQELHQQLNEQKKDNETLKDQNKDLLKRLEVLENLVLKK